MTDRTELERECDVFCRYATGAPPTEYVLRKYVAGHEAGAVGAARDGFDAALARWASQGTWRAQWVDGYAVFFAKTGLLRRKLVLLLSILESTAPTDQLVDRVEPGSKIGFLVHMGIAMGLFGLRLVGAALVLTPARLVLQGRRAPA